MKSPTWKLTIILFFLSSNIFGQGVFKRLSGETDTNYVESYLDHLTTRVYASIKTAEVIFRDENLRKSLIYNPNDALVLGVGFNYGILGLNIGYKFPFANRDDDKYGTTEYLDLQTHIYTRPVTLDIYAQFYSGYYVTKPEEWISDWPDTNTYPKRPDISTVSLGLNGQYIFKHKKFSYRAAFVQNEWQKKSAGSFILGGNVFYVDIKGDSSLIPKDDLDSNFFANTHFSQSRIFNFGITAGYAQTFVIKQHWFITLSLVGGFAGGGSWIYTSEEGEPDRSGFTLAGSITGRGAFGYNSRTFYAGISYLGVYNRTQSPVPNSWIGYNTGVYRFNIVYRFRLNKDFRLLSRP
jgi:hypothetical protein